VSAVRRLLTACVPSSVAEPLRLRVRGVGTEERLARRTEVMVVGVAVLYVFIQANITGCASLSRLRVWKTAREQTQGHCKIGS
jgi:hypothetical protein